MYLHELGEEAASFTKEEMQQGLVFCLPERVTASYPIMLKLTPLTKALYLSKFYMPFLKVLYHVVVERCLEITI